MYSIVLTNGKIINIKADDVCWEEKTKMARFLRDRNMVARINMDNVAGWIKADKVEREVKE